MSRFRLFPRSSFLPFFATRGVCYSTWVPIYPGWVGRDVGKGDDGEGGQQLKDEEGVPV